MIVLSYTANFHDQLLSNEFIVVVQIILLICMRDHETSHISTKAFFDLPHNLLNSFLSRAIFL